MPLLPRLAVAAVVAAAVAAPAAAQADSISYIKDGNVWLSTSDGARQYQVTTDGGYSYASQADDGTLVALHGRNIRKLDRVTGAVQADFATPVSDTPPNSHFTMYGPYDPVISPDGQRIAYYYQAHYDQYDPYCGYPNGCSVGKWVVGTGYSHSDRLTGWDEPGFKNHSGWQYPAWYDNDHVVISHPAEILNMEAWIDTVGDDQNGQEWFEYNGSGGYLRDAEVDRQQDAVAGVGRYGGTADRALDVYWVQGSPLPAPTKLCHSVIAPDGRYWNSPSWSPDGTRLAVDDGVDISIIGGLERSDAACDYNHWTDPRPTTTLVTGATSPDWGPADVPAARTSSAGGGGGQTTTPGTTVPSTDPAGTPSGGGGVTALSAKVAGGALGKALRGGLVVTVQAPGAGTLKATATRGKKTLAKAPARAVSGGSVKLKLTFTKAAKRSLAKARSAKVSVKVTFTPKGGKAQTSVASATLRR